MLLNIHHLALKNAVFLTVGQMGDKLYSKEIRTSELWLNVPIVT